MRATSPLAGKRVLVVEDELMVALMVEELLQELGCTVIGPVASVARALEAAAGDGFDLAVLDVNVGGQRAYPVAELLERRGVPFVLVSGYGAAAVPQNHPGWRVCPKPFTAAALATALADQVEAADAARA